MKRERWDQPDNPEWRTIEKKRNLQFEITNDIETALETVEDLLEQGVLPFITIPTQYIEEVKKTGIPKIPKFDRSVPGGGYSVIAGTLGAEPLFDLKEERYLAQIDPTGLRISPRMTGTDRAFYGTVVFDKAIPAENINIIGKFTDQSYKKWKSEQESGRKDLAA